MFKVSFKGDSKRVQTFHNKATVVTLIGHVQIPKWWFECVPQDIVDWAIFHPSVDFDIIYDEGHGARIEVNGRSICADGDAWNPVVGERIAESRAKIRLYKFMYTLTMKLLGYYGNLLYGNAEVRISESHSEPPKDSIEIAYRKYLRLAILESKHLGELLEKA